MKLIVAIVAIFLAAVVAFSVSGVLDERQAPVVTQAEKIVIQEAKVEEEAIFISKRDISIGEALTEEDFEAKAWPKALLPSNPIYAADGGAGIVGLVASGPLVAGEPLTKSKFRNPNDPSFITGQLGKGMRALTIAVNLTDSVAGFVEPGDLVDIIYTFDLATKSLEAADVASTQGEGSERVAVSETLLAATKILAVDSRVAGSKPESGKDFAVPSSVTLEVSQKDAQKLLLAQKNGRLTLALRSLADKDNYDIPRPVAEQDLTRTMPPAYFPVLFDDNPGYKSKLVNLYGGGAAPVEETAATQEESQTVGGSISHSISVYRGTDKNVVEVKADE